MRSVALVVVVAAILDGTNTIAQDARSGRSAERILADIDAINRIRQDVKAINDPGSKAARIREQLRLVDQRDTLIWELYTSYPDHERVPKLLGLRWMHRMRTAETAAQALSELERALADHRQSKLGIELLYLRAEALMRRDAKKPASEIVGIVMPAIDEFTRRAPDDERGATLLLTLLQQFGKSLPAGKEAELANRVLHEYPKSQHANMVRKQQGQLDRVGKPFDLKFHDVTTGAEVSMEALRGKVVVVYFWATWCGPCVSELPRLKKLYEEYRDKGVEFVGVSLDLPEAEGGRERLRDFIKANGVPWPQFYEGSAGEESLSRRCGVVTLPSAFVVNRRGDLLTMDARDDLESILAKYARNGSDAP